MRTVQNITELVITLSAAPSAGFAVKGHPQKSMSHVILAPSSTCEGTRRPYSPAGFAQILHVEYLLFLHLCFCTLPGKSRSVQMHTPISVLVYDT